MSARRNPEFRGAQRGDKSKLDAAAKRLRDFSGHDPTTVTPMTVRGGKEGLIFGQLDGVLYTTTRDGKREKYIHKFRAKSRPLLAATSDGKQLHIVGGQYEFTEAGIEDR
jgi:hypothetical protein